MIKQRLLQAIKNNQSVVINYINRDGIHTKRTLSNISLSGAAYIRAFCHYRNEYRTFKVSRIHKLTIIDYVVPPVNKLSQAEISKAPQTTPAGCLLPIIAAMLLLALLCLY